MNSNTNIKVKIGFFCLFLLISSLRSVAAEEQYLESRGYKAITEVKAEVADLLEQNKILQAEHNRLKEEHHSLYTILQEKRKDVNYLAEKSGAFWLHDENQSYDHALGGQFNGLEKDLASEEARVNYISSEIMDLDERHRLWKLYLADLQYQKRELELELKLKENRSGKSTRSQDDQVKAFRREIMANREKEEQLLEKIKQIENFKHNLSGQMDEYKIGNRKLEEQNSVMEKQVDLKYKENEILRDKITYTKKLKEAPVIDQLKEKEVLEKEVARLKEEYNSLNKDLSFSMAHQDLKRELLNGIMNLDQENQSLRSKIGELQKNLGVNP